jgi:glutamyl-tRNA reductase
MNVICLGINHQTAPVGLREKFAVADSDLVQAARRLAAMQGIEEVVIVSTCNRVEFYAAADRPEEGFGALNRFLADRAAEHHYNPDLFYKHDSPASIRHLFRVVSGMESMVIGETEILGQVKKAYLAASGGGVTARHLNKLFQRAFNVAKEVRTKTQITRGSVSVGSVAVELAEKIFGKLNASSVLILGAGETAEQTSRFLLSRGAKSIAVANRSFDRAVALAEALGGAALPFEEWHRHCDGIDILVSSTSAPHPIVTCDQIHPVMKRRQDRPLFIIDLAVPRDVEPAVNGLESVYLYDIDSLQAIAQESLDVRRREITVCERLIERHVVEFSNWLSSDPVVLPRAGHPAPLGERHFES